VTPRLTRSRSPILVTAVALLVTSAAPAPARQEPPAAKKDESQKEAGRDDGERLFSKIDVEVQADDGWVKAERIAKPLLLYGDPTRNHDRGSVWGWGEKGRPVALVELFQHPDDRSRWVFVLCNTSTSGRKVRANMDGRPWWLENSSACELKDVPGAPPAAADPALRQRQLKQIASRFTGHQFWDPNNTRYELRRLERPLHAYRDESAGLLDGGLFTLANGTNPEIMLFVEARRDPKDAAKAVWQYTVGRLAHAELHLQYDGKEVFEAPRGNFVAGRNRPYWLGILAAPPDGGPGKP
jgi:hypothetical protein